MIVSAKNYVQDAVALCTVFEGLLPTWCRHFCARLPATSHAHAKITDLFAKLNLLDL